jgi:hypothetical protein
VQDDNGMVETKEANLCDHVLALKKGDTIQRFTGLDPQLSRVQELVSFTRSKHLWLSITRTWGRGGGSLQKLCNAIVDKLHTAGTQHNTVKCTCVRERDEVYRYPFIYADDTTYYEFFIKYKSAGSFQYYIFRASKCPETMEGIANLRHLIYLDTLTMDICKERIVPSLMIVAPNTLISILGFLLPNQGSYKKERSRINFDKKLTVTSNPYDPRHGGTEKTVDGKKAKAITLIKNGVLVNLPLDREESKKAGQRYIPNTFCREVKGGVVSLEAMIQKANNAFFIHELHGETGDDGSFSGLVKNGFLVKDGKFAGRLCDMPVTFNIFDVFKHITDISSERVALGKLNFPYICFKI